jgi:hypothetical protein
MRCIEKNSSWWRFSWLFEAKNNIPLPLCFDAVLQFVDADGFIVDEDLSYHLSIEPQEQKTFRGYKLINAGTAEAVMELRIELSFRE